MPVKKTLKIPDRNLIKISGGSPEGVPGETSVEIPGSINAEISEESVAIIFGENP